MARKSRGAGGSVPVPNLFTPGFGHAPHFFVGRDAMLTDVRTALHSGPRDDRITSVVLGPRGSGKTVTLGMIEDAAERDGWVVFALDASTAGIGDRISDMILWGQEQYEDYPDVSGRSQRTAVSSRLGPRLASVQREVVREVRHDWSLRRQLTVLGSHAAQRGTGVLLSLDEMHGAQRDEMRRLAADLQHITKREELPVAFIGAGLSDMKHTVLRDKKLTFFHRGGKFDMPPLTVADVMRCLKRTVSDAGGAIETSAMRSLAEATGPLPYRMQLLGYHAWLIADAPLSPIDDHAASEAIRETDRVMSDRVFRPTWHDLSAPEQTFLHAVAHLGGTAEPLRIAQRTGMPKSQLADIEHRLVNVGCVNVRPDGSVEFGAVMNAEVVLEAAAREARYDPGDAGAAISRAGRRLAPRCHYLMPRVNARCIRRKGHPGPHRSA